MKKSVFSDVLEAAESLSLDAKEELSEILHKRMVRERRNIIAKEIKCARAEHKRGRCKIVSADEIINEII